MRVFKNSWRRVTKETMLIVGKQFRLGEKYIGKELIFKQS